MGNRVKARESARVDIGLNPVAGAQEIAVHEVSIENQLLGARKSDATTELSRQPVFNGEIQVDGIVEGDVKGVKLCIGHSGSVNGSVTAETTLVRGRVNGEITSKAVTLTATARVSGDILHETLTVEAGARLEGHCRRMDSGEGNINLVVNDGKPA